MVTLIRRVRHWFQSKSADEALREELQFHQEMKRRELERDGLSPVDADVAARPALTVPVS